MQCCKISEFGKNCKLLFPSQVHLFWPILFGLLAEGILFLVTLSDTCLDGVVLQEHDRSAALFPP